jgi:hypothetical protein
MASIELDGSALKSSVAFTGRLACMSRAEADPAQFEDRYENALIDLLKKACSRD